MSNIFLEYPNVKNTGLEIIVTAPGKVILHGDHSVVYGKLALAASLNLRTKVKLSLIEEPNIFIIQSDTLNLSYKFHLEKIKSILAEPIPLLVDQKDYSWEHPNFLNHEELVQKIEYFLNNSNITFTSTQHVTAVKAVLYLCIGIIGSTFTELESMIITSNTDLTIGAGMGSSASLCVCVAATFIQYVKNQSTIKNFSKSSYKSSHWDLDLNKFNEKEKHLICQWSFCAEKIIHGTPSGLDNTTCTYGSIVEYRKGIPPKLLNMSCSLNLLLINTNVPRETKKLVAIAASYNNKFPDIFNNILDALESISVNALKYYDDLSKLTGKDDTTYIYENLSLLYSMNHSLLNAIGVGHRKLDEIIGCLEEADLKGKLTGAGGGGYAICLIPPNFDDLILEKTVQRLVSKGFEVVRTNLGVDGVKLESSFKKSGDCLKKF